MHAIFEGYLDLLEQGDSAEQTVTNNRRSFELFDDFLAENEIEAEAVRLADLKAWLKQLLRHYQGSTVARHAISVRAAYKHAHELGEIEANPTAGLQKLLPKVQTKLPEVLTAHQIRCVRAAIASKRSEMIFYLLLFTGCRAAEIRNLRWQEWNGSWVDFDNDQLVIWGKGGKVRFVPLHPVLRKKLADWQATSEETGTYVIESSWHQPLSHTWWTKHVTDMLAATGVEFTKKSHLFRKTLNTNLQRQGVSEHILDALFGWAPTTIRTKHYSGVASTEVRDALLKAYSDDPVVPEQEAVILDETMKHLQAELDRLKKLKRARASR